MMFCELCRVRVECDIEDTPCPVCGEPLFPVERGD